jgi:hypothetical protein
MDMGQAWKMVAQLSEKYSSDREKWVSGPAFYKRS